MKSQPWPRALSYKRRWQIVSSLARRHRKALLAHPNVVAVHPGLEYVGKPQGESRGSLRKVRIGLDAPLDAVVPCVQVVVSKKWETEKAREGRLPSSVATFVVVRGKRRRIEVPVDVMVGLDAGLHAFECRTEDSTARGRGTGTCFVRASGKPQQFLLGCHHVLALTAEHWPPEDPSTVRVWWENEPLGTLAHLPVRLDAADAALARVIGAPRRQVGISVDGKWRAIRGILPPDEPPPHEYAVLTSRGPVLVDFVGVRELTDRYFGADGRDLTFKDLIYGLARETLIPGDSGAPLVDRQGRLLGIHFAGTRGSAGGPQSFAIRADYAFRCFARPIQLWKT